MKSHTISEKRVLAGLLTIVLCIIGGPAVRASIDKSATDCVDCHTGTDPDTNPLLPQYQGSAGCMACHSSNTSSTWYILNPGDPIEIRVPVVNYTGASAPTEYLAGGNFWFVSEAGGNPGGTDFDHLGHNIFPGEPDSRHTQAPGASTGCTAGTFCHANLYTTDYVVSPGRQGCLKCHMIQSGTHEGFHHADDSNTVVGSDQDDTDGYFRFLAGHMGGAGHGVSGIEDDDWEATANATDHNEYLGNQTAFNAPSSLSNEGHTITGFCSGCHGNFHQSSDSAEGGNWVRHPVGMILPNSGDFLHYTTFDEDVPVGRPDLTDWTGPSSAVAPGTDLINCVSCHRPHGSPYKHHLRWDPTAAEGGCAACHTTKVSGNEGQYHVSDVADCIGCHTAHGDGPPDYGLNGRVPLAYDQHSLVAEIIATPNSGDKDVTYPSGGASDFVIGDPGFSGICEVCHTQTNYYRNNSSGSAHPLYTAGEPLDPDWDCTVCHSHRNEFCRPANQIHATHFVTDPGPQFPQNETGCYECHVDGRLQCADAPLFKNVEDPEGPPQYLGDTAVCDPCHSAGGS